MIRHVPVWLDRFPRGRRPAHPVLRGEHQTTIVIVGGGLTGCACAWSFAAAGIKALLVEADRLGAATTAGSIGVIREDFDAAFQQTSSAHGLRAARLLWQNMHRASLDFMSALRRLGIRCDLTQQNLVHVAPADIEATRRLRREQQARRDAGLEHGWLSASAVARETAIHSGGAVRTRAGTFDPYRACLGLAAAAAGRGVGLFEHSAVRRIRPTRKYIDVVTDGGRVRAAAAVIATAAPLSDLRGLRRHLTTEQSYAVVTEGLPAAVQRELGRRATVLRDSAAPPHFLRWLKDERALFAGASQPPVPARAREKVLTQRSGQLMYELSTLYPAISGARAEWAWDVEHQGTVDGLPFIGTHRNFPRHLFALGHGRHGAAVAWLAARVLLRQFSGEPARGDDLLGFGRILSNR